MNHAGRLIRCAPEHLRHAVAGEEIPWDKVEKCLKENIENLEGAEEIRFEDLRDEGAPPGRNDDQDDLGSLLDDEYMDDWFSSRGDEDDAWDESLFPGDDDYGDLLGPARNDSGSDTRPAGFAIGRASEDVLHTTAGQALDQRRRRSGNESTPWQSQEVNSTSYHKNFDLDADGYFDVGRTKTSTQKRMRWFRAAVANARKRMEVSYKGLNPQDQEAMRKAIEAEWVSFFDSGAAKTIKLIHVPSGKQVIRARLVLTLKDIVEKGIVIGKRPKARLVVLGFEDMRAPVSYTHLTLPTNREV